jgi:hypothetical protein
MFIIETHINDTRNHFISEPFQTETHTDNLKQLFQSLQKEYGLCVSKMYRDLKDGSTKVVGWVFSKQRQYEDCKDTYQHTVWVELVQ